MKIVILFAALILLAAPARAEYQWDGSGYVEAGDNPAPVLKPVDPFASADCANGKCLPGARQTAAAAGTVVGEVARGERRGPLRRLVDAVRSRRGGCR